MHFLKTSELIRASVCIGGMLGGANVEQQKALSDFGTYIGLAFQIVDDILDFEGDEELLGKPIGSDLASGKVTYLSLYGIEKSREIANSTLEKARNKKYVKTIHGRKRPVWDADSDNGLRRQAAERMAINMPIQGSAAEMIKLAMTNIHQGIIKQDLESKMVMQIHDELLFEFPEEEEEALLKLVIDKMENAMKLSVPLVVDYGIGFSWYEAH